MRGNDPAKSRRRLADLRRRIDRLDLTLLRALEKRATAAREIRALKKAAGLPARDPEREARMLENLLEASGGQLSAAKIRRFLALLIALSRPERRPGPRRNA